MSLINDALKRAGEAQKQNPTPPPPTTPLQPVDYPSRPNPALRWLVLVLVLCLLSGIIMAVHWLQTGTGTAPVTVAPAQPGSTPAFTQPSPEIVASPAVPPQETVPAPAVPADAITLPTSTPAPAPAAPSTSAASPAPVRSSTQAEAVPAEPAAFPELKLQSIIFRLRNPTVLINGQMVGKGDSVSGAVVVDIKRYSVTVEWQGSNRVFELPK